MTIDERIAAELRHHAPTVDEQVAWDRIESAAPLRRRGRTIRVVAVSVAALGFLVLGVLLVPPLSPDLAPVSDPQGAEIAFVQATYNWDGYRDSYGAEVPLVERPRVVSVPSAGGDLTLLAEVPGWDDIPRRDEQYAPVIEWAVPGVEWSPDGSRIAFALNGAASGIYVMNRDGSGLTRLTDHSGCGSDGFVPSSCGLAWSPDGSRLAFMSPQLSYSPPEPSTVLYFVDARDGNLTMVAESNADGDLTPPIVWSPDGTILAFARSVGSLRNATHGLYVINADGTEERRLVEVGHRVDVYGYGWSPDGSRLAFMRSDQAGPGEVSAIDDLGGLWVIDADGSGLRKVSKTGAGFTEILAVHQSPVDWSPDGNLIAVPAPHGDPEGGILLVSADGSGERVFGAGVVTSQYSFSPDWSQLVFSDYGGLASEDPPTWDPPSVYVMNTDGTGLRWLADGEWPDWSN